MQSFLGTGWKFPPNFDNKKGGVSMVSDEQNIRESLQILLSTRPGERIMMPEYGCNLNYLAFNTLDFTTINYVKKIIRDAISRFETRIKVLEITINRREDKEEVIDIEISFIIHTINVRSNIVYPFYLIEGTNVVL